MGLSTIVRPSPSITSDWGDKVTNRLNLLSSPPLCRVRRAAAQSIPNATFTSVSFDTEHVDTTGSMFTPTSTNITIPSAGEYMLIGLADFVLNTTPSARIIDWQQNGVNLTEQAEYPAIVTSTDRTAIQSVRHITALAGDVIQMQVFQRTGVSINLQLGMASVYLLSN